MTLKQRGLLDGSTIKVAVVTAVSPTVRDSIQLKWKLMGCSFEQPFLFIARAASGNISAVAERSPTGE